MGLAPEPDMTYTYGKPFIPFLLRKFDRRPSILLQNYSREGENQTWCILFNLDMVGTAQLIKPQQLCQASVAQKPWHQAPAALRVRCSTGGVDEQMVWWTLVAVVVMLIRCGSLPISPTQWMNILKKSCLVLGCEQLKAAWVGPWPAIWVTSWLWMWWLVVASLGVVLFLQACWRVGLEVAFRCG